MTGPTDEPGVPAGAPRDQVAVAVGLLLVVLALVVGLRTGSQVADVDQALFSRAHHQMRAGDGHYRAEYDAMVVKEGVGPTNERAYRLPTLYVALVVVPDGLLRWVVAAPFLVLVLAAWRVGRPYGEWGGTVAAGLVGFWVLGAAPYLYLHAEVWGGALLLVGLAATRRRPRVAALALGGALLVRELFAPAFLFGLLRHRRLRVWWAMVALLGLVAVVHLHLAGQLLDPNGYQPPLRFTGRYLSALSPGDGPLGSIIGVGGGVAGIFGLVLACRRGDEAARTAVGQVAVLAPATILIGRTYWAYTWGPALACFAAVTVEAGIQRRRRPNDPAPTSVDQRPSQRATTHPTPGIAP